MLSAGHACVLQYSLLHLCGYDLGLDDLEQFRQWGSRTPGHPERGHTPGIEVTTGPLGQGVGNAVGMAIAERFLAERFNRPGHELVDHHIYAICSDGDLMEGISQEAASIAGHFGLGKLIVCYDDNHITIDGTTALSFDAREPPGAVAAEGWHVQRVEDSEDVDALDAGDRRRARDTSDAVVHRDPLAHRLPRAARGRHGQVARLGARRRRGARDQGGDGLRPRPEVLGRRARVRAHVAARRRRRARRSEWQRSASTPWREAFPEMAADWDRAWQGRLRDGWREALPTFAAGEQIATRSAGQKTMAAFAEFGPTMIGGAADLVESTKTLFEGGGEFSSVHAGRNVPFGIREHGDGRDRQRRLRARRHRQAVRLDVPDLLRLHARQPCGCRR